MTLCGWFWRLIDRCAIRRGQFLWAKEKCKQWVITIQTPTQKWQNYTYQKRIWLLLSQFNFIEVHFEHLDCKRFWAFSAGHTSRKLLEIKGFSQEIRSNRLKTGLQTSLPQFLEALLATFLSKLTKKKRFTFWIDAHSDYDKCYPGMMAHIKFGMTFVLVSSEAFEKMFFFL